MTLPATPDATEERRNQAALGGLFFWVLFFGQAKKGTSPVGARLHNPKNLARSASYPIISELNWHRPKGQDAQDSRQRPEKRWRLCVPPVLMTVWPDLSG